MKFGIFAVYDNKTAAFMQPFYSVNDRVAERAVRDCVNDPEHAFGRNPHDYVLYSIGQFNDADGTIESEVRSIISLGILGSQTESE